VVVASALLSAAPAAGEQVPAGWFQAGSHPNEYEMKVDSTVRRGEGKASATVKATASDLHGFGTLMQNAAADAYRGKRIRFSGYVKSEKVADRTGAGAGLWLRIDGPKQELLGFDNMMSRSVKGTTDWRRYEIVLDVPNTAASVAFGILLNGDGQVWMDDLNFEVVSTDVPVTGRGATPAPPQNLNFER
jgi:hypothetical protein